MATEQEYQLLLEDYVAKLRDVFAPAELAGAHAPGRGAEPLPVQVLAQRAENLVGASRPIGELHSSLLESADGNQRAAAELKLLAQATAEAQVAQGLLEAVGQMGVMDSGGTSRSARAAGFQESLDELADILESPMSAGVQPFIRRGVRAAVSRPTDPAQAKAALKDNVDKSVRDITGEASMVGVQAARDLLLVDQATLVQGVSLLSKDAADLLDQMMAGLGGLLIRLARSGFQLLLQAYDWVLALLGKDIESQARKQVADWIDEIRKEAGGAEDNQGFFEKLVARIYGSDAIVADVAAWVTDSQAGVDQIDQAADTVVGLAGKFKAQMELVEKLLKVVAFAKNAAVTRFPQVEVLAAALTLGTLGYVLFTGYDHVDSGRVVFNQRFGIPIPDRVEGVRETVHKALGVT
jgi:hypothetical protein